jgi:hypothetical protein
VTKLAAASEPKARNVTAWAGAAWTSGGPGQPPPRAWPALQGRHGLGPNPQPRSLFTWYSAFSRLCRADGTLCGAFPWGCALRAPPQAVTLRAFGHLPFLVLFITKYQPIPGRDPPTDFTADREPQPSAWALGADCPLRRSLDWRCLDDRDLARATCYGKISIAKNSGEDSVRAEHSQDVNRQSTAGKRKCGDRGDRVL